MQMDDPRFGTSPETPRPVEYAERYVEAVRVLDENDGWDLARFFHRLALKGLPHENAYWPGPLYVEIAARLIKNEDLNAQLSLLLKQFYKG